MQCVALDAQEERIAAGDVGGRIHLWNAFGPALAAAAGASTGSAADQPGQSGKKRDLRDANLAKETLHWHAAGVSSLAFSADGTYLLSGGREAVLVRLHPCVHPPEMKKTQETIEDVPDG